MSKSLRVLILEDQIADVELILHELRQAGFNPEWHVVQDEEDYLAALGQPFDVILSDFQMPQFDGIRALELLNQRGLDLPFILVSGTIGEDQAVACMRQGADDYLLKDRMARLGQAVEHALHAKCMREQQRRADRALRESEDRYRTLFEGIPIGLYRTTPEGRILDANPALIEMFGYPDRASLLASGAHSLFLDPDSREAELVRLHESHDAFRFVSQMRRADGSIIWVEDNFRPVRDDTGTVIQYEGSLKDISDRVRVEAEKEQLFHDLQERVKELSLLHKVARILQNNLISLSQVLDEVVLALPGGWQYSDELAARIEYDGATYTTPEFRPGPWKQSAEFSTGAGGRGTIEVFYCHGDYGHGEDPFLDEEYTLLCSLADMLASHLERRQAELALRSSEHRYRTLFETMIQGVVYQSASGEIIAANPAAERILGLTLDQMMGRDSFDPRWRAIKEDGSEFPGDQHPSMVALKTGQEVRDVSMGVFQPQEDQYRWIRIHAVPQFRDGEDQPFQVFTTFEDITAQVSMEQALRAGEARYRSLIETSPDAIVLTNLEGEILLVNRQAARMGGYESPQAVIGASGYQYVVPRDVARVRENSRELLATGASLTTEYTLAKRDGSEYPVELSGTVIKDNDGHAQAFLSIVRDITQRKQREREREAILRVATALRAASHREEMLPVILDEVMDLLQAGNGAIVMVDPVSDELVVELARGAWAQVAGQYLQPGEGLNAHVVATSEIYASPDVRQDPHLARMGVVGDLYAVAGVPLIARENTIGALWVARAEPFSPQEVELINAVAEISANAIHRATLHAQTEQRLQRLSALRSIDLAITSSMDLRVILNILLNQVVSQLHVDAAAVLLLNPHTQTLTCEAGRGFRSDALTQARVRIGEAYAGQVALERKIIRADLARDTSRLSQATFLAGEEFVSYCGVPLVAKGQVQGVLEVFHRSELRQDPEWSEYLETLASQAAIAIDNAQMFEHLERSNLEMAIAYDETIAGWSRALELRDMETDGHSRRVTDMTMRLAREVGVTELELVHVRRGALLHDIGKMGIPDYILRKPGQLTQEEWEIMRQHPVYAYKLLAGISFLRPALDIPYCHHERWDGSGYPRGLRGEQIPLAARAFSVVDVWDALLSDRPYRGPWSEEKVLAYLKEQAGIQFDPDVVQTFLQLLSEVKPALEPIY